MLSPLSIAQSPTPSPVSNPTVPLYVSHAPAKWGLSSFPLPPKCLLQDHPQSPPPSHPQSKGSPVPAHQGGEVESERPPSPWSCPSATAFPHFPRVGAAQKRGGLGLDTLFFRSNHASHTGKSSPFQLQQPHFIQRQVHCNRNPFFSTAPSAVNLPRPGGDLT